MEEIKHIANNTTKSFLQEALYACRRAFKYNLFFSFVASIITIATSMYSLQVFDRVLSSSSVNTLVALTVITLALLVVLGFLHVVRTFLLIDVSNYLNSKLSDKLLDISISKSAVYNNLQITQNLSDLNVIKGFLTGAGINSLFDAPWAILYIIAIYFIHPLLCIIVIISAICLLVLAYYNEKVLKPLLNEANELNVKNTRDLELMNRNAEVIEAMGMKNNIILNYNELSIKIQDLQYKASRKSGIISNITKTFRMFVYIFSTAVAAYLVINNKMSPGGMVAVSILSGKALAPFDAAMEIWKSVINTRKSYDRLNKNIQSDNIRHDSMKLDRPEGHLELERISFVSPITKKTIIKGINIKVNAGEIVGVLGPSGAGKTVLAKLIAGIWQPTTGVVRLDGANIYTWNREDVGNHVGYLPQDIELFNGSVKDNISRMDKKADSNLVIEASENAFIHDMVLRLPRGYETDIGISGTQLSAGQRQRIALARAFYGNPRVIVLDEPNSNLDQEGDVALSKAILKAKEKQTTVIVISHRQSILNVVDKLLVIYDGEAKMFGARDEVLKELNKKPNNV